MGCDIHSIFQRKTATGWEDVVSEYDQDRDYELFGILAGVRGLDMPIKPRRGMPQDFEVVDSEYHPINGVAFLSPSDREYLKANSDLELADDHPEDAYLWMGDHSYTWYTGDELMAWWNAHDAPCYAYFFDEVARLVDEHKEIRFVCGYDS